jgi:hypothetical protein
MASRHKGIERGFRDPIAEEPVKMRNRQTSESDERGKMVVSVRWHGAQSR